MSDSYYVIARRPIAVHLRRDCNRLAHSAEVMRLDACPTDLPLCKECEHAPAALGLLQPLATLVLLLCLVAVAHAQPASVTVSTPTLDAAGATFAVTWPGTTSYPWVAAYSDGSAAQSGTAASPLTLRMPYHASGTARGGFVCVGPSGSVSCAGYTVPAKVATAPPPPVSSTHTVGYVEPTTNTDGTPLADLAEIRAYWRLDGGPETVASYPAASLTGGAARTQSLTVPATSGVLTVQITAVDVRANEGPRTPAVSKTLGGNPPSPIPGSPTFTLTP